jgi:hypothetical protein
MASLPVASPCAKPRLAEWRNASGGSTTPVEQDLSVYQGDGFSITVEILHADGSPFDLTGYTAASDIRHGPADLFPDPVTAFTVVILLPDEITLSLLPEQTLAFLEEPLFYDLEITSPEGMPQTILRGRVIVTLEITRPIVIAP